MITTETQNPITGADLARQARALTISQYEAFADWARQQGAAPGVELSEASHRLTAEAIEMVRMAVYMNNRGLGGTHAQAVRDSNNAVAKTRRALDYSYPRDDRSF